MEQTHSALSNEQPQPSFWERAGARLPAHLRGHAKGLEQWLAQGDLSLSNVLLTQTPGVATAEHESRQFEDALLALLDKEGGNKRQVISWLQITYIVIAALNEKGANIHPVRLAIDIRPSKSPFIRERVSQIALVENWRKAFFRWLMKKSNSATPEHWQAAALLCSSMCGCLIDHRKLVVLANQLNVPIQRAGRLAYFDFQLPYRNLPGALLQRWFPDPLSEMILLRAQQPRKELIFDAKSVRRLLAQFFVEIGVPKTRQPRSLQMFTNAVSVYWESKGTQIDVRFASSSYVSQSLKPSVWQRLNGCPTNDQAGQESKRLRGLRELHDFLVRKYGCESVDVADTFGKEAEVTVVEARIISVDEYRASDEWLRKKALTGVSPKLIDATRLVLMLAFRLGMRRMEIIKLRLCDLHLDGAPDILVRPHPGRRLKSVSSKRRMPLSALLEPDELDRLLEWANRRAQEEILESNSDYFFVLPTKEHIPVERTVDLIHEAMREVTGDDELHLHHLRHSFATWTYLKLRATSHPDLIDVFEHMPLTHKYLQGGHIMRQKLIPGSSIPSRSDAYCVSRLLGHSGPNVSMDHYIHSSDLLVYGCARRDAYKLEKPIWVPVHAISAGARS